MTRDDLAVDPLMLATIAIALTLSVCDTPRAEAPTKGVEVPTKGNTVAAPETLPKRHDVTIRLSGRVVEQVPQSGNLIVGWVSQGYVAHAAREPGDDTRVREQTIHPTADLAALARAGVSVAVPGDRPVRVFAVYEWCDRPLHALFLTRGTFIVYGGADLTRKQTEARITVSSLSNEFDDCR